MFFAKSLRVEAPSVTMFVNDNHIIALPFHRLYSTKNRLSYE